MKKLLPLITVLLVFPTVSNATEQEMFTDLSHDHVYAEAVYYLRGEGVLEGYEDGTFKADNTINRAEFLKIVIETWYDPILIQECSIPSEVHFSDVGYTDWYAPYVCIGARDGILHGYPDGTFRAGNTINFVEAAKILANLLSPEELHDCNPWFKNYVNYLADMNGIPLSIQAFDQEITRGEMAEMVFRNRTGRTDRPSQTYKLLSGS